MIKSRLTVLLSLPLLLAACGGASLPTGSSVSVVADRSTIALASTGDSVPADAATTFTFTNRAGGQALKVSSATVTYGNNQTLNVPLGGFTVPGGFSCSDGSTTGCDTSKLEFTEKTFTKALTDTTLFGQLPALNNGLTSYPVTVSFPGVSNTLNFTVKVAATTETPVTIPPVAPAPVLTINTPGNALYSGNLSVTVAGNFDATSTVDRIILQTTDANGTVDNTTYTSNQPSATFSVDTAKFPDGGLTLQAIAITKADGTGTVLRGQSAQRVVGVQNITAPVIEIAAPLANSTFTGATLPVQVNVTRKNSTFAVTGGQMLVDLLDYRGQRVATQTITGVNDNGNGSYTTAFDVASLPADTYTVRVQTGISVSGGTAQTVTTVAPVTLKSASQNPPAVSITFPVALRDPADTSKALPMILNSFSGALIQVSDDTGLANLQVRLVRPDGTVLNAYLVNEQLSGPGPFYEAVRSLDIDGSQYVPNGPYTMRVTVADISGNRNIQEIPVMVDRSVTVQGLSQTTATFGANEISNKLSLASATWTLNGLPTTINPTLSGSTRVVALLYKDGVLTPRLDLLSGDSSDKLDLTFGDVGAYRVDWMVEDLNTGAVRIVNGTEVTVVKNP